MAGKFLALHGQLPHDYIAVIYHCMLQQCSPLRDIEGVKFERYMQYVHVPVPRKTSTGLTFNNFDSTLHECLSQ